ncbi:MAG TPA: hypothetical protein VF148_02450 [Acidimicrobiia bacterium]
MTLARWGYLLYGGCVLGNQALAAMTDFKDSYFGLGAQDHRSSFGFGVTALGHAGTVPGYTHSYWRSPRRTGSGGAHEYELQRGRVDPNR